MSLPYYQFGQSYTGRNYDCIEAGVAKYWTRFAGGGFATSCVVAGTGGVVGHVVGNGSKHANIMFPNAPIQLNPYDGMLHVIHAPWPNYGFPPNWFGSFVGTIGSQIQWNSVTHEGMKFNCVWTEPYIDIAFDRYGGTHRNQDQVCYRACRCQLDRCGCLIDSFSSYAEYRLKGGQGVVVLDGFIMCCANHLKCYGASPVFNPYPQNSTYRFAIYNRQESLFTGRGGGIAKVRHGGSVSGGINYWCNFSFSGFPGDPSGSTPNSHSYCFSFIGQTRAYNNGQHLMTWDAQWCRIITPSSGEQATLNMYFFDTTPEDWIASTCCGSGCATWGTCAGEWWCKPILHSKFSIFFAGCSGVTCWMGSGYSSCSHEMMAFASDNEADDTMYFAVNARAAGSIYKNCPKLGYFTDCCNCTSSNYANMFVVEFVPPYFNSCVDGSDAGGGYLNRIWPLNVDHAPQGPSKYAEFVLGGFRKTYDGKLIVKTGASPYTMRCGTYCCSCTGDYMYYPIPVICTCNCSVVYFGTCGGINFDLEYTCRCTWLGLFGGHPNYEDAVCRSCGYGWCSIILAEYDCDINPLGAIKYSFTVCESVNVMPFWPLRPAAFQCNVACFRNYGMISMYKLAYDPAEDSAYVFANLSAYVYNCGGNTCNGDMSFHGPSTLVSKVDADLATFCNDYFLAQDLYAQCCGVRPYCTDCVTVCCSICGSGGTNPEVPLLVSNAVVIGCCCWDCTGGVAGNYSGKYSAGGGIQVGNACWIMEPVTAPALSVTCYTYSAASTSCACLECYGFCSCTCSAEGFNYCQCNMNYQWYKCGTRACGFCCNCTFSCQNGNACFRWLNNHWDREVGHSYNLDNPSMVPHRPYIRDYT